MKRILLISALLLAVIFTVSADRRRLLGARNVAAATCTSLLDTNYTTGTATYQIGSAVGNEYAGQTTFDPGASVDICAVEANISKSGTITSFNYVCEIWTLSGTDLQSKIATSASVAGGAWSSTLVSFSFNSSGTRIDLTGTDALFNIYTR